MNPFKDDTSPDPCRAFRRNPDGSWTCVKERSIAADAGKLVTIQVGDTVRAGDPIAGYDLGAYLDRFCDRDRSP